MNIDFKIAELPDIDMLLKLMQEFYIIEHLNYDEHTIRIALVEIISNSNYGLIYLVNVDGNPEGYFILTFGFSIEFHGRDALVDEFYIRENIRGKGIGSKCLKVVEQVCLNNDIKAVHLEVDHTNIRAKELYLRMGYTDHNRYLLTKWIK